jgi:hypothetical protein
MMGIWEYGQVNARTISTLVCYSRIAEAIGWCRMILLDGGWQPRLRTEQLRPRLLHDGIDQIVCDLGYSRSWQIRPKVHETTDVPDTLGGRLLVYFPDADLADCAAMSESGGFFDQNNVPPWDTWISFFDDKSPKGRGYDRYLLAYVPHELIGPAARGIHVNPEQCIVWLDDADVALRERLPCR